MKYVFDTNILRQWFKSYYASVFISLWDKFEELVDARSVISVREAYHEIMSFQGPAETALQQWAKTHPEFFEDPTEEEQHWVKQIFEVPHFRYMISKQKLELGGPCADPFIVAKAKVINGVVVTLEAKKPNAARIPNVCEYFNVECIDLEMFMHRQGWQF